MKEEVETHSSLMLTLFFLSYYCRFGSKLCKVKVLIFFIRYRVGYVNSHKRQSVERKYGALSHTRVRTTTKQAKVPLSLPWKNIINGFGRRMGVLVVGGGEKDLFVFP